MREILRTTLLERLKSKPVSLPAQYSGICEIEQVQYTLTITEQDHSLSMHQLPHAHLQLIDVERLINHTVGAIAAANYRATGTYTRPPTTPWTVNGKEITAHIPIPGPDETNYLPRLIAELPILVLPTIEYAAHTLKR